MAVLNTIAAQLEQVSPILRTVFEDSDEISSLIKKQGELITNLSRYLYRFTLQEYRGGAFRKYSAAGGSLGKGTGMKVTSLQAGYFYSILMYRVEDEAVDLTQNTKQAVINVMKKTLSEAMQEAAVLDNISFFTDGTGALTNASSASNGTTTLTFAGTTDTVGVRRLRPGMTCEVWTATGAGGTVRSPAVAAPLIISSIDVGTKTVTFNQTVTALASGDLICVEGMASYGPAYPISFQAGWPATSALTTEAGLTNDSFRHGLYYAHNSDSSYYYLGKLKSSLPSIQPQTVDAGSDSLVFAHGLLLRDKLILQRDEAVLKGMVWIAPTAQRAQIVDIGTTVVNKVITGDNVGNMIDLLPKNVKYSDTFQFCDMPGIVSKRQDSARMDAIIPGNWGRAELIPLRPYEKGGQTVFPVRSSDALAAASEFGFQAAYDWVCFDPGREGFIYGLKVPSGY